MNKYGIIVKEAGDNKYKIIKEIKLTNKKVTINFAKKAEQSQMLLYSSQTEVTYVLDMLACICPELNISPIVIEEKKGD